MWIAGIILILVGLIPFFVRRSRVSKLAQVLSAQTSTCAQAADACRSAGAYGTADWMSRQVEVKGVIEPRELLRGELSERECVCCKSLVEREWEEHRWRTDPQGHRRRTTHRGRQVMSQSERLAPFFVSDGTGRVLVNPEGAEIDWVESVNRFERGDPDGGTLSFGGFTLGLGGLLGGGRRTIGYRYREWILTPGQQAYVLGGAGLSGQEPCIKGPSGKGQKFIVSLKSEEEIIAAARRAITWLTVAFCTCWVAGLALIVAGLVGS